MATRALRDTYRRRLRDIARDHYGYVTTQMAADADVPAVELRKLTARGGLKNVTYGLYKFDDLGTDEHAQFMEAVLAAGPQAHLIGETVLALHNLALVNPAKVRVGTPRRVRAHLPEYIELVHDDLPAEDLTAYDGIPSATVARALVDCAGTVMGDRLRAAVEQAQEQGLLRTRELARVQAAIEAAR